MHNDYPLAPDKLAIPQIIVKKIADKYKIKVGDVKKFILNLGEKTSFVFVFRNKNWLKFTEF